MIDQPIKDNLGADVSLEQALEVVSNHSDFKILRRVPERRVFATATEGVRLFHAAVIDLETLGLDPENDPIIEIGFLRFSFTTENGIIEVKETYNGLHDPGVEIPEEITKITGITNEDVQGQSIDWEYLGGMLKETDLVICHNSSFDRNFLELQTPEFIKEIVENSIFGCSMRDIDWKERGFEATKLEFLNFKAGWFYEGHRALIDCWATLNIIAVQAGSFEELKNNVRKKDTLICAVNTNFESKDLLKERGYRWSDGKGHLPKSWWTTVSENEYEGELNWLDDIIYNRDGASKNIPVKTVTARQRYSYRAELMSE